MKWFPISKVDRERDETVLIKFFGNDRGSSGGKKNEKIDYQNTVNSAFKNLSSFYT